MLLPSAKNARSFCLLLRRGCINHNAPDIGAHIGNTGPKGTIIPAERVEMPYGRIDKKHNREDEVRACEVSYAGHNEEGIDMKVEQRVQDPGPTTRYQNQAS